MTKKSSARLQRDAAKAREKAQLLNNTCWDDLNQTYTQCVLLLQQHVGIAQLARETELIKFLADPVMATANIKSLGQDLRQLSGELAKLKELHAEKTGGSQDPEEVMYSIQIFEQYNLFMERHQAVVVPTALHILEQFNQAEQALAKFKASDAGEKARSVSDNSPIDVEVREPAAKTVDAEQQAAA